MLSWRNMLILISILGLVAVCIPAAALADSGSSAGDQQYVDPLGTSHSGSHHSSGSSQSSSSSSSGSSSGSASSSSSSSSSPTLTTVTTTPTLSSTDPTATVASTTSTAAASATDPHTLPRTGFDLWLAAALGVLMLGSGAYLRRAVRSR